MLKLSDFSREFPVAMKTDRDAEIPLLLEFLKKIDPIESLLDIGCHYSSHYYTSAVRKLAKRYDGIDILDDTETRTILDNYYIGNAIEHPFKPLSYDVVICVSTIEHAGVSTYKKEVPEAERNNLFCRCLELAKKYVWISFPVGQQYTYPNELSIIPDHQLKYWERIIENYKVTERFLYTQGAQSGHPWYEHQKRDVAVRIPYIDYIGNQNIAVLEIEKT